MTYKILSPCVTAILCICASELMAAGNGGHDFSPKPQEKQLPRAMHSAMADCMVDGGAKAATVFPVVSAYDTEGVRIEDLVIEGNKEANVQLNGCRGAGIFLYRAFGTVISGCTVRNYNGDGISFQQSNDVTVVDCISEDNAVLGIHPGSGSQRPTVRNCVGRRNGSDGLFLCWRVRHGLFEDNTIENNGGAEIRIRGEVNDLTFIKNTIRDTRQSGDGPDVGILIEERVGRLNLQDNTIQTKTQIKDKRASKAK